MAELKTGVAKEVVGTGSKVKEYVTPSGQDVAVISKVYVEV